MDADQDIDLRAAEYVLGTLDPEGWSEMAQAIVMDADTASRVRAWERRLAPLLDGVPLAVPPRICVSRRLNRLIIDISRPIKE